MVSVQRIKERKLAQWALAYLAGGWLCVQVTNLIGERFGWPEWLMRTFIIVYAIGLFVTLVLAWYHGEKGAQRVSGMELAILAALLFVGGLGLMAFGDEADVGDELEPSELAMGLPNALAPPERRTVIPVARASVAVLPFTNLSSDPEQAFFSDGLTEELMDAMGRIPGLKVAGRTSSFAFRDRMAAVDSVGRALRVAHVLDGSVRKAGLQLRISAQLIDARTGYRVWSETFDRELEDVFAVQAEISTAIAEALRVQIGTDAAPAIPAKRVKADPEAHLLLLQALHHMRAQTPESYAEAVRLLHEAIAQAPDYAKAHAELAAALTSQAYSRFVAPDSGYAAAAVAAKRARALDPQEARAYSVLATIAESHAWQFKRAERLYRRALEINPNDASALANYAFLLVRLGQGEEAMRVAEHAAALDPLSPGCAMMLAAVYQYAGFPERAVAPMQVASTLAPGSATVIANLANAFSLAGRHAEAMEAADEAARLDGGLYSRFSQAYVYARAGKTEQAHVFARAVEGAPFYLRALMASGFDDREGVLANLERSVSAREDYATTLMVDPAFAPFRADPRVAALVREVGLER